MNLEQKLVIREAELEQCRNRITAQMEVQVEMDKASLLCVPRLNLALVNLERMLEMRKADLYKQERKLEESREIEKASKTRAQAAKEELDIVNLSRIIEMPEVDLYKTRQAIDE